MSIADDIDFIALLDSLKYEHSESRVCGGDFGTAKKAEDAEAALIAHIDLIRQGERKVWIIIDAKGECVMMRPTEPTPDEIFAVAVRVKKTCTCTAFYLRPAP